MSALIPPQILAHNVEGKGGGDSVPQVPPSLPPFNLLPGGLPATKIKILFNHCLKARKKHFLKYLDIQYSAHIGIEIKRPRGPYTERIDLQFDA